MAINFHFIGSVYTLRSLINVQSVINVQGDKFSKKNKRTGRKSSSKNVGVKFELDGGRFCSKFQFNRPFIIGSL